MGSFLQRTAVVWKMAAGSTLAWEFAKWTGSRHPFLAPLTVILVVKGSADKSVRFAWQRVGGTLFGVLFAVAAGRWLAPGALTLGLLLLAGGAILLGVGASETIIREASLSILLVPALMHQSGYAFDRVKDTVIGAVVALFLMLLVPSEPQSNEKEAVSSR